MSKKMIYKPLDIYPQNIYSSNAFIDGMDEQTDLFRYLGNLSELSSISDSSFVHPKINSQAKKLCKCGCGQEIIFKKHHKYCNIKFIHLHHLKGKYNPMYGKSHSEKAKKSMSESRKVSQLEEEIFNNTLNNNFFHYFLGFYVGDGNKGIHYTKKGCFEIGLKITKDNKELLTDVRNLFIDIRDKTKQYSQNQGYGRIVEYFIFHKKANKEYSMLKLRFGLKTLKLRLDEWGLRIDKGKCFDIPEYYLSNKDKFGMFLAGLIDADGWFNFNKKVTSMKLAIALGDLNSCENLKKVIKELFDIDTNIRKEKNYNTLYFHCNRSYKQNNLLFKKLNKYVFPYIRLKNRQVELTRSIYEKSKKL